MSSGFVSAGSEEKRPEKDDDWLKAQRAIDDGRGQKLEAGKQEGGKSLYEVLQQNKSAKQEAFEENLRLKNQFRSLDDDEVDFLDSVLESTRAKEQQVKRETAEQLEVFRKQREAAEKELSERRAVADTSRQPDSLAPEESWATSSRKRRRAKEKSDSEVVKLRKNSYTAADDSPTKLLEDSPKAHQSTSGGGDFHSASSDHYRDCSGTANTRSRDVNPPRKAHPPRQNIPPALGLGLYSSDED